MKPKTLILILAAALLAACTQTNLENDGSDRQKQVSDIEDVQLKSLDEQIDSIAATLEAIDSTGSLEEGDISDLEEMESKFTATLESAKESVAKITSESGGTSDSALEAQIAEIQKRLEALEAQIEALREQIDSLKESYNHLGDIIGDLTTISYIPSGADNTVTVMYHEEDLAIAIVPDTLSLRFDLYSEDAANTVVAQWKSALSVKAVYLETKASAGDMVNLEVVGASASDGILTILIWPRKLDLSFSYYEDLDVKISLVISSGKKKVASEYIQLVPEHKRDAYGGWMGYYYKFVEFDANKDGVLSDEELAPITELSLNVSWSSIDWLLRKLPNLEKLSVYSSSLTCLDLSYTPKLTDLSIGCREVLQEIILPDSQSLTRLDCSGCSKLENLDLSNNTNLTYIDCSGCSKLENLDLSNNTNLTYINVENCNNLVSLEGVEKCGKLEELYTAGSGITELEIPNLTFLKTLSIPDGLTRLNIDNDKSLSISYISEEGTELDWDGYTSKISYLSFAGTPFTMLRLCTNSSTLEINAPQLIFLIIDDDSLLTLDASNLDCLIDLEVSSYAKPKLIVKEGLKPAVYRSGQYVSIDGVTGIVYQDVICNDDQTGPVYIVSTDETSATWDYYGTSTGATSFDDGVANTDKIASGSSAAKWCRAKGAEWYLPAQNELEAIYDHRSLLNETLSAINGTLLGSDFYWSSTEFDSGYAYGCDFSSGSLSCSSKTNSYKVRAVRKL